LLRTPSSGAEISSAARYVQKNSSFGSLLGFQARGLGRGFVVVLETPTILRDDSAKSTALVTSAR
jgi:hypothetical protein